ncbi:non-ribosomal peptide synthetase [Streptomyces sp. ME19-01-6]|uniref:non-ribosomal peptide synthetase n=1 Tax=Streptomyces sp. ME19-01-6 TaxID=3028686 RepID=UPI0029B6B39D|nr:non-ribosomal peptide synthetase [Streptomyces sp. ME19-01-6]MDX3229011.1 amino acid adenylation domain-containing protein [Streptomyces sp. ME19-01-6]
MVSRPTHPLSPSQSGIWYAQNLDPTSPVYNCLQYLDIQGAVDTALLIDAIKRVVMEVDGLHVRFDGRSDPPGQILLEPNAPHIAVHDFTAEPDPMAAAHTWLQRFLRIPFDLEAGHVSDFAILEVAPGRTLWAQRYHHVVADGYAFNLIAQRVAEVYRALRAGGPVPLARFQTLGEALDEAAHYRTSAEYAASRAYWLDRFADRPAPLELTEGSRTALTEGSGTALAAHEVRRAAFTLPAERHRALRAAAREAGTNFPRALIATVAAYTARMTGREDIVVGLASRSRATPTAERFPGMMSDVLPLRLRITAATSWAGLLADTHEAVAQAVAHQRYRGEDLRRELGWPERRRVAGPLVNLIPPLGTIDLGGASGTLHNLSIMPTEDLTLCCFQHTSSTGSEDLRLTLDAHPDRCDDAALADHHERLVTLLDGLGPDTVHRPVAGSGCTGPRERARLLDTWNEAPRPLPEASLGELFRQQAARTPDAVAVVGGDTELSYRELDARSDRLAGLLRERGVRSGSTALVFMERSVELLVALLAVLKTGAAYVPLDERQPATRLRTLIAEADGDLLLVDGATRELPVVREQDGAGLPVADVAELALTAPPVPPAPDEPVSPDAPACVMYTSGSTGVPSGVQITHRNLVALAHDRCWSGGAHQRVLWHSPHAFDAVQYELWVPLLSGGQICVAPPGALLPATLRGAIARHGVTAAWLTAGLFAALAEEEPDALRGLREVWTGGDVVSQAAVARVFDTCPGIVVVNGYGPTETTTFATRHRMTRAPRGPVPIGRAMDNTTLYVLDADGRPVPQGAPGELWVGGAHVSAGYVNRPESTRERFRANPFHPGRMYRTGDLVRLAPDGTLFFLGRADDQVKIRGFRIEPHDIELSLERHPDVARAVVVPQLAAGGGRRLVAYLVPTAEQNTAAPDTAAPESGGGEAHEVERVREWQDVYEDMYREGDQAALGEDFGGWMDSYRGTPIPRHEMREWRDRTADRVLALRPRRILEIGVGSGLLLARLAPHCAEYWATDFSERAVSRLAAKVREDERLANRLRLLRREARDLSGIPLEHFDCVVVNSVVQYLPSAAYLSTALRGALDALTPGGHLFVGDVRPKRLLREFRTGVELRRPAAEDGHEDLAGLKRAVERAVLHEKELLVEPEFFTEHLGALPEVAGVDVRVKRGRAHNELTQFRYEAVLRKVSAGAEPYSCADATVARWGHDVADLADVGRYLRDKQPSALRLAGVPNARVLPLLRAEHEVCAGTGVAAARDALDGGVFDDGFDDGGCPDPEDFAALGRGLGLRTVLTWAKAADGSLDVLFLDPTALPESVGPKAPDFVSDAYPRRRTLAADAPAEAFTNQPIRPEPHPELAAAIEAYAQHQLPDYMTPSAYVVLDHLPLSVNGKVNRAELPPVADPAGAPPEPADETDAGVTATATPTERELAAIWSDLLRTEVDPAEGPDFFALGGHSLLATRLVSRVSARLGVDISLRTVFEKPRLTSLAQELDARRAPAEVSEEVPGDVSGEASDTPGDRFPASGFQERIWLDERLRGTGSFYNVPLAWRVRGGLDPTALRGALGQVVARHEALRTRFVEREPDGRPQQVVKEPWVPEVVHRVAEGATGESRLADARAALDALAQEPFDIASGRLLRVMLVDLEEDGRDQLLMCALHHLVWDIGSEPVFLRDLERAYAECVGQAVQAAPYQEYPATPHQQRMAFVEHFERGTVYEDAPVYHNVSQLLALDAIPAEGELRQAVAAVLDRHPALRTTVELSGGTCTQRVHERVPVECATLTDTAPDGVAAWLRRPFHLAEGPLFRVAVAPRGGTGEGCALVLVAHLAVADRASLRTVGQELATLLDGGQLPPAPSSFTQWWQARDTEAEERQTARLAELLDGGSGALRLPEDRARAAVHIYEEHSLPVDLPDGTGLAGLARREGVSTEAALLAAYTTLLMWYSGQTDLTVGVANPRRDTATAHVVGPMDDFLPLRLRGGHEQSFASWARACEAGLREVRACGHAPFDEVARRVAPPKDMSRTALFDVVFDFEHDAPEGQPSTPAVGLGKCDLLLTLRPTAGGGDGDGVGGRLVFNGLYYDPARMRLFAEHWQRLLRDAATRPDTLLGAFEPLTEAERHRQIEEWNDTAADYPHTTLARLVSERAARHPDRVALAGGDGTLTYRQLVERAERLARVLVNHGVRPGDTVGLRVERGTAQIEAVLAVLLAGAAYVPIDPAVPADRAAFILTDSAATLLLTNTAHTADPGFAGPTVRLDEIDHTAAPPHRETLPEPAPDDLAYVIYTSGTTGRPKGVRVTHRNVVRLVAGDRLPFRFGPDDVWVLAHSYAFDFSVWEIFGCLVHGGRLVVPDGDELRDPRRVAELVRRHQVTVLNQTPSMFAQLVRVTDTEERRMASLRYVILGGARFAPATLGDWPTGHPGTEVVNMYGITETTVHVTARTITAEDIAADRSPIGTPLPTTTVRLLDPHPAAGRHRMLPVGAVGEICVGGEGVAAGYVGRPELERERFVPDPYGSGRLYRSGDLGRYRPDGTLEYLGRMDDQLQVRGYRIEPAEVETCLTGHPDVAQAQVTVDEADTDRLVAHLWCPTNAPDAGELRARLAERLPAYMVPSVFKVADRIPLSVNGKVDLAELAARSTVLTDGAGSAPRTETARALAPLWGDLLPVPEIFADTSFFEAGGHSLLAATLLSQVSTRFGVDLPVRTVFEHPRLGDLADRIDEALAARGHRPPGPAGPAAHDGRDTERAADAADGVLVPASDFQRRIALDEQLSSGPDRYAMPLVWRVRGGRLEPGRLRRSLDAVVARHEALRTGFVERGGRLWQRIGEPWSPPLEEVDLSGVDPAEQDGRWREWVREVAGAPFDPASGRLLRPALIDLGEHGQLFVLCLHHLVCDGPSLVPLVQDMNAVYEGAGLGDEVVQYREFVRVQGELVGSVAGRAGVERWCGRLAGAPAYVSWPEPGVVEPSGVVEVPLGVGVLERLRGVSERESVSWFMAVAAGFAGALHRWSGERDVTFGCPVANRGGERFGSVVGPCTNTVVIRSVVDEDTTALSLLRGMRERVLEALEDQHVPFDQVVAALNPERRYGITPYAGAVLNLAPVDDGYPLGGTVLTPVMSSQLAAEQKFPVTVTVFREDGTDRVGLSYRGDQLSRRDAEELAGLLRELLTALADTAHTPVLRQSAAAGVVQYREFVRVQGELVGSVAGRAGVERWCGRLAGAPAYVSWPEPGVVEPSGVVEVPLGVGVLERLRGVSERESVSWFMAVAAGFAGALHRWSGERDVTFGCPVANRGGERFGSVVGPCTNTVVIRSVVDEDTTALSLLRGMRERVLEALEDQHVPFDQVVAALNPERRYGITPYADVALTPVVPETRAPSLGGHRLRRFALSGDGADWAAKGAVTVSFQEQNGTLRGLLAYRGDRIGRAEAERLAALTAAVLADLVDRPDRPLASLPRVGADERAALAVLEQGPAAAPPTTVPHLIAARVRATPDATAIDTPEGPLGYAALDARARRLAARIERPVGQGQPVVAVLLDRGPDLVVAMLAAWYAGCAYCPVDPGYPPERVAYILDDLGARVVLTDGGHQLPDQVTAFHVTEETQNTADGGPVAAATGLPSPDDPAYVVYTSGSTGLPKGVVVRHGGLAQHAQWFADLLALGPADRVSQLINVGFDAAVSEIWPTLTAGAALVPHPGTVFPGEVSAWLDTHQVTVAVVPAALVETIWAHGEPPRALRRLVHGGAALGSAPPPGLPYGLVNCYGPTEATVTAASHILTPGEADFRPGRVGRPAAGVRVHVVDESGHRCPVGVKGEILIGGSGVALGYWRRPELTAERFLPDGPEGAPGPVYRTGDLGRWLPDGTLEFIGRADRQLKVRGHRIEPEEIEARLAAHPLVAQAAVRAFEAASARLVAYAVPSADAASATVTATATQAVLGALRETLPPPLVPDALVWLDALPLTPHGKVDHAALPRPGRADLVGAAPAVAPQDDRERRIAALWREVLGVDTVGVHDNFFDLGGDSLRLATLQRRLEGAFGIELPVQRLFEHATVHAMARAIDGPDEREHAASAAKDFRERARKGRRARQRDRRPATDRKEGTDA